jgi:hypothetical protein
MVLDIENNESSATGTPFWKEDAALQYLTFEKAAVSGHVI